MAKNEVVSGDSKTAYQIYKRRKIVMFSLFPMKLYRLKLDKLLIVLNSLNTQFHIGLSCVYAGTLDQSDNNIHN